MILNLAGLGTMQQVVGTITTTEGARSSLNNPGNLIYVGQAGASPSQYTFVGTDGRTYSLAQFSTPDAGAAALQNQIQIDANKGMTIQDFANSYAPAGSGNNPTAYAQYIANATGLSVTDPLSSAISSTNADPSLFPGVADDSSGGGIDPTTGLPIDSSSASIMGMDPTTFMLLGGATIFALWFALK